MGRLRTAGIAATLIGALAGGCETDQTPPRFDEKTQTIVDEETGATIKMDFNDINITKGKMSFDASCESGSDSYCRNSNNGYYKLGLDVEVRYLNSKGEKVEIRPRFAKTKYSYSMSEKDPVDFRDVCINDRCRAPSIENHRGNFELHNQATRLYMNVYEELGCNTALKKWYEYREELIREIERGERERQRLRQEAEEKIFSLEDLN